MSRLQHVVCVTLLTLSAVLFLLACAFGFGVIAIFEERAAFVKPTLTFWAASVLIGTPTLIWFVIRKSRVRLHDECSCMNCGYNLRENVSGKCPECGYLL